MTNPVAEALTRDLEAIHDTIVEGSCCYLSDKSKNKIDEAYEKALKSVQTAESEEDHDQCLVKFFRRLGENTFRLQLNQARPIDYSEKSPITDIEQLYGREDASWITLPHFDLHGSILTSKEERGRLQEVISRIHHLREKSLIVFDLRGHRGGDTETGMEILKSLFGRDLISKLVSYLEVGNIKKYRASKKTIEALKEKLTHIEDPSISRLIQKMEDAVERKKDFVRIEIAHRKAYYNQINLNELRNHNLKEIKVYVVTSKDLPPAAIRFVEVIRELYRGCHIGERYKEISRPYRKFVYYDLPSGKGGFEIPIARIRTKDPKNIPVHPSVKPDHVLGTSRNVKGWVNDQLRA